MAIAITICIPYVPITPSVAFEPKTKRLSISKIKLIPIEEA